MLTMSDMARERYCEISLTTDLFNCAERPIRPLCIYTIVMKRTIIVALITLLFCRCLSDGYYVDMVDIEGGTFIMGSDDAESDEDERPLHAVTVHNFKIGRYEVTQKLWNLVMHDKNPSVFKGNNRPVECVSWYDVQIFLERLNRITGHSYRLPSEVEWEYAAKGGRFNRDCKYSGGEIEQVGWFVENSDSITHNVGLLTPNDLGIYDMCGNVHEWCDDLYDSLSYTKTNRQIGSLNITGLRVYRGGSWASNRKYCRIANRNKHSAELRHCCLGFRLAEDIN